MRAANRAEETRGKGVADVARWNVAPAKTDVAMVHIARGLAWVMGCVIDIGERVPDRFGLTQASRLRE